MQSAPKPCSQCGVLVSDGTGRCSAHKHVGRFGDRRRGSRHERGYGTAWEKTRTRILQRDGNICQHCLRETGAVHPGNEVDHIVPKAQGGSDSDDNLQTICTPAHREKTQREAIQARARCLSAAPLAAPAGGGGAQISGPAALRTGRFPNFLRAQVSGEGGVAGQAAQSTAGGAD